MSVVTEATSSICREKLSMSLSSMIVVWARHCTMCSKLDWPEQGLYFAEALCNCAIIKLTLLGEGQIIPRQIGRTRSVESSGRTRGEICGLKLLEFDTAAGPEAFAVGIRVDV